MDGSKGPRRSRSPLLLLSLLASGDRRKSSRGDPEA
jgi:hypothetical protein